MIQQFSWRKWHPSFFPEWQCVILLSFLHKPHGSIFSLPRSIAYNTTRVIFLKQSSSHCLSHDPTQTPQRLPLIFVQRSSSPNALFPFLVFAIFYSKVPLTLNFLSLLLSTGPILPFIKLHVISFHQEECQGQCTDQIFMIFLPTPPLPACQGYSLNAHCCSEWGIF